MNELTLTAPGDGVYAINLSGYTPPPRYGDVIGPWTGVRVEEASSDAGEFVELVTGSLSPQDSDPTAPETWRFTVAGATLAHGYYRLVWLDEQGDEQPTEVRYNGPPVRPNVKDIAKLLPQRATLDGGARAFTFDERTEPTGEEVDGLIDVALQQVLLAVPNIDILNREQVDQVRGVTGYLAAVLVENAHFSDQVEAGDSLVTMYQGFFDAGMASLTGSVDGDLPGGPSAFSITTGTCNDMFERTGRVSRDPYCSPWTGY